MRTVPVRHGCPTQLALVTGLRGPENGVREFTRGTGHQVMSDKDNDLLRELKDRQDIYDCVMRYCRGIDRLDRDILLSAYHPDAWDDHGTFVGPVDKFWDYVYALHFNYQHRTQHHITNHRCDLDGDVAHTESYYL